MAQQAVFIDGGNGMAVPAPYVIDTVTGVLTPARLPSNAQPMTVQQACACGGTVINASAIASSGVYPTGDIARQPTVTPYGDVVANRNTNFELSGGDSQNLFTITLQNTANTAYTGILGDGLGLAQLTYNYASDEDIVYGGIFGTATKTIFDNMGQQLPALFAGFKLVSSTANFFENAVFKSIVFANSAQIVNQVPSVENWNLSSLPTSSQYNDTIQQNQDWRFTLFPGSGIQYTIPASSTVTLTMVLRNVQQSVFMGK